MNSLPTEERGQQKIRLFLRIDEAQEMDIMHTDVHWVMEF